MNKRHATKLVGNKKKKLTLCFPLLKKLIRNNKTHENFDNSHPVNIYIYIYCTKVTNDTLLIK